MQKEDSSYAKLVHMHINGYHRPFLYEIFSACNFRGIECALWRSLYHTTAMGKSMLEGQTKCQNILHAQSAVSFAGLHVQVWTAEAPVCQVAVQIDNRRCPFFKSIWVLPQQKSGEQIILANLLAAPKFVSYRRSQAVWLSILFHYH